MDTLYFNDNNFHIEDNVSISRESLRAKFTHVAFSNGQYYLITSDKQSGLKLDESSYNELFLKNENSAKRVDRFHRKLEIPDEFVNKHCILFANKVFFSADTYDEIIKARDEKFKNLDVILYHPHE